MMVPFVELNDLMILALTGFCTLFVGVGAVGVWRIPRRLAATPVGPLPPVSVLKPLCGVDDDLADHLETFFTQTHPDYELVFGVEGEADPALAVVRALRNRYPDVPCRVVVHDGGRALNPKVSNLTAMLEAGSHDVVVISDSNVAAPPTYVERMAASLTQQDVGLVTNLFVGRGERDVGAAMENLHLNGVVTGSVAASSLAGPETVVVGKSMMFRRSVLERLGGLASVATVLAEDYVIGRMFQAAGFRVAVSEVVLTTTSRRRSLWSFAQRQARWNLIRSRVKPVFYALEPVTNPVAVALLAVALGAAAGPALLWAIALSVGRDTLQHTWLRGPAGLAQAVPLAPLKDLVMLAVWAAAPFMKHVTWRGRAYRVSAGTRLYAPAPVAAPTMLRTE